MKPIGIHQFHSGSAYGDAVTNGLFLTQKFLRELGFISEIYVEHIAKELNNKLNHYSTYVGSPNQLLLIHHSLGHNLIDWVLSLPDIKILVYHNITPASFFPQNSEIYKYSLIGREQLNILKNAVSASIADSLYNAQELISLNYPNISTIPLLIDVENIKDKPYNHNIVDSNSEIFTVIFVGRVCQNKCQHDIVEIFKYLVETIEQPIQLILIGGYSLDDHYCQSLQEIIARYRLTDFVKMVGKVSDEELYGWYRAADVFICMSEHEGFGVPLVESMIFDVPVVAYKSTNVPYTLGQGGILFNEKRFPEIAALVNLIRKDRSLRRRILKSQRSRLKDFSRYCLMSDLAKVLIDAGVEIPRPVTFTENKTEELHFQIEGPFETNYSLAIVNRELGFALDEKFPGQVGLFPTEGFGDYTPDITAINQVEGLDLLWKRSKKGSRPDVVIRNLYPPRVVDMDGLINLLYFAWEESNLSKEWVDSFNQCLDGLTVLSSFVKKVLIDAGVYVPIQIAGCGIEQVLRQKPQTYHGYMGKSFRFLHISSCFPRKGVDVLLAAYVKVFTSDDDVSLLIKTFPNPHNDIQQQIDNLKANYKNIPEIILINEDIPVGCIIDLYRRCHALVAPSRGEGFGLPMAEAMLFDIPVITTGFGGQTDFCSDETAWLIDFQFTIAKTHLSQFNSVWVEPDVKHLAKVMREIYQAPKQQIQSKVVAAKALIQDKFTWKTCAARVENMLETIESQKLSMTRKIKLGWVSTWNSKCGIAAYSSYLINGSISEKFDVKILASRQDFPESKDSHNVIRCWDDSSNPNLSDLESCIETEKLDAVVIQFNFGFFELTAFGNLLVKLSERGIVTIIMFHSTRDVNKHDFKASLATIHYELSLADRLLVHSIADLNRLKDFQLIRNTALFPHGVQCREFIDSILLKKKLNIFLNKKVIATYGFLLPNKGVEQLIKAFSIIKNSYPEMSLLLVNALYPNPVSHELKVRCERLISSLGLTNSVVMINEYLEDEESLCLLECADMIVFPYQNSNESSSAAVRFGIASNRLVLCSKLEIFEDVKETVHFLPGTDPNSIARGIVNVFNTPEIFNSKREIQQQWLQDHSWQKLSDKLAGMIQALVKDSLNK